MSVPRPGPGEMLVIADGEMFVLPRSALPLEPPIGSIAVREHQLDEAVARVLKLIDEND